MAEQLNTVIRKCKDSAMAEVNLAWRTLRIKGPGKLQFWLIALMIGIAAGFAALGFRMAISGLQSLIYGADDVMLASAARELPWYIVLFAPIIGGLIVGFILNRWTRDGKVRAMADVIESAALNEGRVARKEGLASAIASLVTLSTGGSTGREGPVVHLGAVISSRVAKWINANGITARDLLGCAAAAAVSASFNAPIAGVLFALEVILRHYAMHAFAPIVIASVAGTLVSRLANGDITEFTTVAHELEFYHELPAFLMLGILCGLVAVALMKAIFWADTSADYIQERIGLPSWLRPACAGALLGLIALVFPHIIGVGYETTTQALSGNIFFWNAIVFIFIKIIAVAITIGGRMGGGVFSPSLMVGALTGIAFGWVATSVFPTVSGGAALYAIAGMGGVAAAVLGAPISTTLIVFEMTGDWQTGLAVMVTVSLSTALASRMVSRSFFLTQLARRGVHLASGPQAYLLATLGVARLMRSKGSARSAGEDACWALVEEGVYLDGTATLEVAMPMFEAASYDFIPIVTLGGEDEPPELWGALFQVDALRAYNRALADTAKEEHS